MTSRLSSPIKNDKLVHFISASILRKVLASFDGKMEYRRLRWIVCSRTSLTKKEATQILLLLKKVGLINTSKPQANSEQMAWLTEAGHAFLLEYQPDGDQEGPSNLS